MKRAILVALVALLSILIVPQNAYARDLGEDDKWLTEEEENYVNNLNAAYAEAYSVIASIGRANQAENLKKKGWNALTEIKAGESKLVELSSKFQIPPPGTMQELQPLHDTIAAKLTSGLSPCYGIAAMSTLQVAWDRFTNWLSGPKPEPKPKVEILGFTIPDPDSPEAKEFQKFLGVSGCVDRVLGEMKGQLDEGKSKLDARVKEIEAERKEAAELIDEIFGCFIATAAYGTPAAEEINILRQWRDEFLLHSRQGKAFVDFYYEFSPPIADFISEREVLRTAVREGFVDPVVNIVELTQSWWKE